MNLVIQRSYYTTIDLNLKIGFRTASMFRTFHIAAFINKSIFKDTQHIIEKKNGNFFYLKC